jgi:hypothetical protein
MNLKLKSSSIAILTGIAASVAIAEPAAADQMYDFTYSFYNDINNTLVATGDSITGSFTGTQSGSDVTNIANVAASFDGTPLTGPLEAYSYTPTAPNCGAASCYSLGGAVASFNGLDNNFLFINSPPSGSDNLTTYTNYFYVIQPWTNPGPGSATIAVQFQNPSGTVENYNGDYVPSSFQLTAVPEPLTLSLFGAGLAGAAAMRRRKKAKQA